MYPPQALSESYGFQGYGGMGVIMSKPVLSIIPKSGPVHRKQDACEVLEWAKAQEFETVIVFGFKDGDIHTRTSACEDCLRIRGALDAAKEEFWERK
jgi:hypothetical protein